MSHIYTKTLCTMLVMALGGFFLLERTAAGSTPPDGKTIYQKNCSVCHSLKPPRKSAPPIVGMAAHYHEAFKDRNEAVEHMVQFMKAPDSTKSKLEPQAISRFGLMPAMSLTENELRSVSEWLLNQFDPKFTPSKNCK
ncbi:MAG: cytochrome c [Chlorobiales bacterium]|nr:cytochrome c [Chlorobiales bacterium]